MPVINIREIDTTSPGLAERDNYIVFVPGNCAESNSIELDKATLFTSLADFKEAVGDICPTYALDSDTTLGKAFQHDNKIYDAGYLQATLLLNKGLQVLYKVPSTLTKLGGDVIVKTYEPVADTHAAGTVEVLISEDTDDSGNLVRGYEQSVYDGEYKTVNIIERTYSKTRISTYASFLNALEQEDFYEELKDKAMYDIRFVTNGGYLTVNTVDTVPSSLVSISGVATQRGDCVALIDHDWNLVKSKVLTAAERAGGNKYAAMYSPWCAYKVSGIDVILPASAAYLEAFADAIVDNPTWYATAGALRGNISGTPIKEYGEAFANTLSRDTGVSVNPITTINPYGVLIWGNRTLYNNAQPNLVASCFLNIRQLCCDLKKQLYVSAKAQMFEQNTDRVWFNFKSQVARLLDNMQTGQGIRGYKVFKLTPDSKAQIKALIRIIPIEAVEKFDITVNLSDTLDTQESE